MATFTANSTFVGAKVRAQTRTPTRNTVPGKSVVRCSAKAESASRRQVLNLGAIAAVFATAGSARADLVDDLLAKSSANKELNDKKRLATSGANFARSRTVTDGTCAFPNNLIGCENVAERGDVKFLSDDLKLECEGTEEGKICAAKAAGSLPSFMGV